MRKLQSAFFAILILTLLLQTSLAYEKTTSFSNLDPALISLYEDSYEVASIAKSNVAVDSNFTLGFTLGHMFKHRIGLENLAKTQSNPEFRGLDSISSVGKLAYIDVLPPTLILQYHFKDRGKFRPFIGAGVNYTLFSDEIVGTSFENTIGGNTRLEFDDSYGLALQAGVDYMLTDKLYINTSVWYMDVDTDTTLTSNGIDRDVDVDIDPWIVFTGIGVKF